MSELNESESGRIYVGVCVDTACTLGICAERNAIFHMLTNGEHEITKSKEELNALKKEIEDLNEKCRDLTPEELKEVTGGTWKPEFIISAYLEDSIPPMASAH